jgi:hypothetical protein
MVFSVASVAGVLTAGLAAIFIWLLLAEPMSVATAVDTGDLPASVRALAAAITDVIGSFLRQL